MENEETEKLPSLSEAEIDKTIELAEKLLSKTKEIEELDTKNSELRKNLNVLEERLAAEQQQTQALTQSLTYLKSLYTTKMFELSRLNKLFDSKSIEVYLNFLADLFMFLSSLKISKEVNVEPILAFLEQFISSQLLEKIQPSIGDVFDEERHLPLEVNVNEKEGKKLTISKVFRIGFSKNNETLLKSNVSINRGNE